MLVCGSVMAQQPMTAPTYKGPFRPTQQPAAGPATLYTNFSSYTSSDGNGTTCNPCTYDTNNGFLILATANCWGIGNAQSTSFSFVLPGTGAHQIQAAQVAVTLDSAVCTPTQTKFDVVIYNDACAGPNTELGRVTVKAAASPCTVVQAKFRNPIAATGGQTYWIACEPVKTCSATDDFSGVWWESYRSVAYFSFTCPVGSYAGGVDYPALPGAFAILGR